MNSLLTFGKYAGRTPEELKRIDPGYLRWGAENLRSPKWRAAFRRALASMTDLDRAHALAHDEPTMDVGAALQEIRGQRQQEEADEVKFQQMREAQEAVLAKWLPRFPGKTLPQLRGLASRFEMDWQDVPRRNFSSDEAYGNFRQMMAEYNEAGDSVSLF